MRCARSRLSGTIPKPPVWDDYTVTSFNAGLGIAVRELSTVRRRSALVEHSRDTHRDLTTTASRSGNHGPDCPPTIESEPSHRVRACVSTPQATWTPTVLPPNCRNAPANSQDRSTPHDRYRHRPQRLADDHQPQPDDRDPGRSVAASGRSGGDRLLRQLGVPHHLAERRERDDRPVAQPPLAPLGLVLPTTSPSPRRTSALPPTRTSTTTPCTGSTRTSCSTASSAGTRSPT